MEIYFVIAAVCLFVAQLIFSAIGAMVRMKRLREKYRAAPFEPAKTPQDAYIGEGRYFFENDVKKPPLYELHGAVGQYGVSIPPESPLTCGADELAVLLRGIDPAEGTFDFTVRDGGNSKAIRFSSGAPDEIRVRLAFGEPPQAYEGRLVFPSDMQGILTDFFAGMEVIAGFGLRPAP